MMNRRGFFKQFGATIAAVALIQGLIRKPKFDHSTGISEDQLELYNKLPNYFVKAQKHLDTSYDAWKELLQRKEWPANLGSTIRSVS